MTHMTLPTPSAAVGGLCFKRVPYLKIPSHSPLLHHRRRNCGCGSASSSSSSSSSVSTTPRGSFHTPSPEDRPGLTHICNTLELCFFEVCIRNLGRPLGVALHGFVSTIVEAFTHGYTREQLSLEIAFGSVRMNEFEIGTVGCRLTSMDIHYRSKWLETVYITLHMLNVNDCDALDSAITSDAQLYSTIRHTLDRQNKGEEPSFSDFDRGKGAPSSLVSEKVVISPQMMPVSQLVLLTVKVINESK